jgi:putative oxidoreductase
MNAGLLIVRLVLGLGIAAHGAQKLFGWFGGHGLEGTDGFFEKLGFRPGKAFALLAGLGELGGGLLVALGLFGPAGPAIVVLVMIVAAVTVHLEGGFFAASNGIELPLLYAIGVMAIAFAGPGAWSLDAGLGLEEVWTSKNAWFALAAAVLLAARNLVGRRESQNAQIGRGEAIEAS